VESCGEVGGSVVLTESLEEARCRDPQPLHQHSADRVDELRVAVTATRRTVHSEAASYGGGKGDGEGEVLRGGRGQSHTGHEGLRRTGALVSGEHRVAGRAGRLRCCGGGRGRGLGYGDWSRDGAGWGCGGGHGWVWWEDLVGGLEWRREGRRDIGGDADDGGGPTRHGRGWLYHSR